MHTEPRPVKGLRPEIVVTRVAPRLLRLIPPYMMMMWMTMIYIMVIWMMMMSLVTTRYPGGPSSPYSFLFHGEDADDNAGGNSVWPFVAPLIPLNAPH